MKWFTIVVLSADPPRYVRAMTDAGLNALIHELAAAEQPNGFMAEVYAVAVHEALRRWRVSHGSLVGTIHEEEAR
jgi:hypothetical protein